MRKPYILFCILHFLESVIETERHIHEVCFTDESILNEMYGLLENAVKVGWISEDENQEISNKMQNWCVVKSEYEPYTDKKRVLIGYLSDNVFDKFLNPKVSGDKLDIFCQTLFF